MSGHRTPLSSVLTLYTVSTTERDGSLEWAKQGDRARMPMERYRSMVILFGFNLHAHAAILIIGSPWAA